MNIRNIKWVFLIFGVLVSIPLIGAVVASLRVEPAFAQNSQQRTIEERVEALEAWRVNIDKQLAAFADAIGPKSTSPQVNAQRLEKWMKETDASLKGLRADTLELQQRIAKLSLKVLRADTLELQQRIAKLSDEVRSHGINIKE